MRRLSVLLCVVGIAGMVLAASTSAGNPPTRLTFTFDDTFQSVLLTNACGFPVFVHIEGTAAALVLYDATGTIVREIDTQPGFTVEFAAPSTGKSFAYPAAGTFDQKYVNGTAIGSHVDVTQTGIFAGTGSGPPNAGRIEFDAIIIDTSPGGLPVIETVD